MHKETCARLLIAQFFIIERKNLKPRTITTKQRMVKDIILYTHVIILLSN